MSYKWDRIFQLEHFHLVVIQGKLIALFISIQEQKC